MGRNREKIWGYLDGKYPSEGVLNVPRPPWGFTAEREAIHMLTTIIIVMLTAVVSYGFGRLPRTVVCEAVDNDHGWVVATTPAHVSGYTAALSMRMFGVPEGCTIRIRELTKEEVS